MSLTADMKILDQNGHTALWYISHLKSTKREELFAILDSSMQTVSDVMKRESADITIAEMSHTDICEDNRICLDDYMEPKIDIRQDGKDERKRSSRTSSLPSLWNGRKDWGKTRHLHPLLALSSSSIPALPAAPVNQLSKSAPILMNPLLHANGLLQARANIQNRLRGVETGEDEKQKIPQTPCSRTPNHIAPLDSRYTDNSALSSFEHPLLFKQTSILPVLSQSRRRLEKISRQSSRRSRAGSEESNSCSSSSQEEDEAVPQITQRRHVSLGKSMSFKLGNCLDFQDLVSSVINISISDKMKGCIKPPIATEFEDKMKCKPSKAPEKDLQEKSPPMDCCHVSEAPRNIVRELQPTAKRCHFLAGEKNIANLDMDTEEKYTHEKNKPVKMIKRSERKGKTSIQTNQSFNVLAHRNQSTGKISSNRINSPTQSKVQLRGNKPTSLAIGETTNKYVTCKKNADEGPTPRRVSEPFQHVVSNDQKQLHRDLKSARAPKKPVTGPAQRARSAVDYATYNDMFLKIGQGDEGPAIYEMFATPLYENLRADSSAERKRQIHTPLQVKRQISGKLKGQKTVDVNRRKKTSERSSRVKCRQLKHRDNLNKATKKHLPPSECKCHVLVTSASETSQRKKFERPEGEGKDISSVERQCTSILSVIEEVLSNTASKANLIKNIIHQEQTPLKANANREPEVLCVTRLPAQPLINTWTSDGTASPVYQRFLEGVGDGPLTDDLLRSLAEELLLLERRDIETLKTENEDGTEFNRDLHSKFKILQNEGVSSGKLHYTFGSCSGDAITWTKGEVLGKGAYGTVYCGLTSQGQLIAVKQVALDASTSEIAEKEYDRLEREVDLLKNLKHTNIVGFLGTALSENIVSIFMEYIPGGSISNILGQFGPLPEKVFVLYSQQILEGVAYLHANRVIHRDLKGNNIMLMPTGVVKLIDFGCARRLSCLQTSTGSKGDLLKSVHGTPYWMAPEVINETGHGRKSDIWSIGCTVFEMATGKPPLAHMNKMAALYYIGARRGLMPSLSDDFSTDAKDFVQACLTRDQRQRPSAEELLRHPFISHHSKACYRPIN
ncbi:mitogen-activated protein kinase kinase kinase 19 isoform X3 [Danio rerio]